MGEYDDHGRTIEERRAWNAWLATCRVLSDPNVPRSVKRQVSAERRDTLRPIIRGWMDRMEQQRRDAA